MNRLEIGNRQNGRPFTLDPDVITQKLAILGISGSGKTCAAAVLAEEMCKNSLPWILFDPVGVFWGMRASRNGSPGGYPVVVFGGDHGDLPLEKDAGAKIAEALISENVFAVIDLSLESKRFWHQFVTDFSLTLMQLNPEVPRHIFVEEASEMIPQRTKVDLTARCKEAMERLIRLGRNRGYGFTLISQRPATVDKDCLALAETLLVLRTVGAHDRKALSEWLMVKTGDAKSDQFLSDLQKLENGQAYFWSPHWKEEFTKIRIRERVTFHPGETRKVGHVPKAVALCDVRAFVERLKPQLSKTSVSMYKAAMERVSKIPGPDPNFRPVAPVIPQTVDKKEYDALAQENEGLKAGLRKARQEAQDALGRLERVKKALRPYHEALGALFGELGAPGEPDVDQGVYAPWLDKAGRGKRHRMLEVVLERKELTRAQLSTLSGTSFSSSGFKNSLSWMKTNKLVEVEGDVVRLVVP